MKSKNLFLLLVTLAISLIIILSGLESCDKFNSLIEDQLREDEFEVDFHDKVARESFEDPILFDTTFYTGITEKIDTSVVKDFIFDKVIRATLTNPVKSDSFSIDSTFIYRIDTTIIYHDLIVDLTLTSDMKRECQFDTMLNVKDTVMTQNDTLEYTKFITYTKNYYLTTYMTKYANQQSDLFYSVDLDSEYTYIDKFYSVAHLQKYLTTSLCTYQIVTESKPKKTYIILDVPFKGDTYFYFDDYIKIRLYKEDDELNSKSEMIPIETSAYYFTLKDNIPNPVLKTRYIFKLNQGQYLLEIESNDQTLSTNFRAVILRDF